MRKKLYKLRFELFFLSLMAILFSSLFFPTSFYIDQALPVLFIVNVIVGLVIFLHDKERSWITVGLLILVFGTYAFSLIYSQNDTVDYIKFGAFFVFYIIITLEVIKQVWKAKTVDKSVIFGLMSGYICLGLLAFFAFVSIELTTPNSFKGLPLDATFPQKASNLLYYSYVTLMTIGYGDITPTTGTAQKASILFAMIGQFYLVIITAVVIEKYIRHQKSK